MEDKNNEMFTYTYSAAEQKEVEAIRAKYMTQTKSERELKLEQLRRLDESVTKKGTMTAIAVGVFGTLVLGFGMSCTLVWGATLFVPGIIVGVIGLAGVIAAYPLYDRITKKERERITPQILKLTEELL